MSELKPCPFCGNKKPWREFPSGPSTIECEECGGYTTYDDWQNRPIEDALREQVARLEKDIGRLRGADSKLHQQTEELAELRAEVTDALADLDRAIKDRDAERREKEALREQVQKRTDFLCEHIATFADSCPSGSGGHDRLGKPNCTDEMDDSVPSFIRTDNCIKCWKDNIESLPHWRKTVSDE